MKYIDTFLNGITMYRLVMWGLAVLALISVLLGFLGVVAYSGFAQLASFSLLTAVCYGTNVLCARLYHAPRNYESAYITAFILFFILEPSLSLVGLLWLVVAGVTAIISKYVLAIGHKHIWNPAALGAFVVSLLGSGIALWWVATPILIVPTALLGLLVVRKIRRYDLFLTFVVVSVLVGCLYALLGDYSVSETLLQYLKSWPIIFFGTIMLTEPATTPQARGLRFAYAALVGAFFSAHFSFGTLYASPELALLIGNVFAYLVSPKEKLTLTLQSIKDLGSGIHEFVFQPKHVFRFSAGQYLEWTVSEKGADVRGNRRYFTISSAPEDAFVRVATRIPSERPSSFKKTLSSLVPGDTIVAGALAGDFVLSSGTDQKYAFIAGGIGITPFISMVRSLQARGDRRDIVLFCAAKDESDFVFKEMLREGESVGIRTVYVAGSFITEELIRKEVSDYGERTFYVSGPNAMVEAYKKLLRGMNVSRGRIKEDYFPGL